MVRSNPNFPRRLPVLPVTRRQALISAGAFAAASTLPLDAQTQLANSNVANAESGAEPVCLTDFEPLAKANMPSTSWEFLNAGAGDEITVRWNKEAYQRIRLKPRVLVDVSHIDTHITLLGQDHAFPILLAPVAAQKLVHSDGEMGSVRGAGAAHATMVLSSFSTTNLEDVSTAAKSPLWLQFYAQTDHGPTRELVQRAQAAGYRALCMTVDMPVSGARNREERAKVQLPPLSPGSLNLLGSKLDPAVSWKDVEWLCSFAKIPLLLKGILNPDDADRAVKAGVAGIMVSNHGGRNFDTVPATIDALPLVAAKVAGRVPVLVDGGIRRGTDIVKALAFGANAVLIGRPYVYGLGAAGEAGVTKVLSILQHEFQVAMALTGTTKVASIDRSVIWS
jgi:4-hydroxymandelate oxidase